MNEKKLQNASLREYLMAQHFAPKQTEDLKRLFKLSKEIRLFRICSVDCQDERCVHLREIAEELDDILGIE